MTVRYVIYPGHVRSRTDGDRCYVDSRALAHLYGVAMADCLVMLPGDSQRLDRRDFLARAATLIPLYPRADGVYERPPGAAALPSQPTIPPCQP